MRLLTAGESALLMEFTDRSGMKWVAHRLRVAPPPGVLDILPAERTIMVVAEAGTDLAELRRALAVLAADNAPDEYEADAAAGQITIPVRYDGPDLAEVARLTNRSEQQVIALHCSAMWRCEFIGFAPGFGYLTNADASSPGVNLDVPRRSQARSSVAAGSVALAGRYSAVYPRSSPGGWQLIGTTELPMWDLSARPPAAIQPDMMVRFVDVDPR